MGAVLAAIVPVFLVAACGLLLRKYRFLDAQTLSTLNIYLLIPALVFHSLSQRELEWALFGRYAVASVIMLLLMTAVLTVIIRLRRIAEPMKAAMLLTQFPNLGNFGLPLAQFAFGEEGLALAVVVMVCGSFLQNSVGVYYAQRARFGILHAFGRVFRFPMIYAFALALVFQHTGWETPLAPGRAIGLIADAAIPCQLLILGIKLAENRLQVSANVFLGSLTRLCAGPALAAAVSFAVGLEGLPRNVFILQMSAPVAVGMAVYGVQFDVKPGYLASVVSWTFLLSMITVSAVLWMLMRFA